MSLLTECHRAGQTIVLVTHDQRVGASAGRLVHMEDGLVVPEDG
jgi:ABC-type lipoprotein export system ATPase subunit